MKKYYDKFFIGKAVYLAITFLFINMLNTYANAHVMRAQHGTLNYANDGIYLVLSLPVSAFSGVDDNQDGLLSGAEFDIYQEQLKQTVNANVVLSSNGNILSLKGLLLSPVHSYITSNAASEQLVIMGKYELSDANDKLLFKVNLFGQTASEQELNISVQNKNLGLKKVATLSPKNSTMHLFEM